MSLRAVAGVRPVVYDSGRQVGGRIGEEEILSCSKARVVASASAKYGRAYARESAREGGRRREEEGQGETELVLSSGLCAFS